MNLWNGGARDLKGSRINATECLVASLGSACQDAQQNAAPLAAGLNNNTRGAVLTCRSATTQPLYCLAQKLLPPQVCG